jgi:hypothetical protein
MHDARCMHRLRAAERGGEDLLPKRTLLKRLAAAAAIPLRDAALPHVHELADRAHTRHLSEQAVNQRAAASPNPADVDNPQRHTAGRPNRAINEFKMNSPSSGRQSLVRFTPEHIRAEHTGDKA